ncbi:MAG: RNA methyltransferase [Ruminococcaceae bacterium]|nr:RNA methyltransferase [Oscillospiraceae bacterium]
MIQKETTKFTASTVFEGMTSISAVLNSPLGNDRKIESVWVDQAKKKSKASEIGFLLAKSKELGFPVNFVEQEKIDELSIGNTHGGILAFCTERTIPRLSINDIVAESLYVYLEGIEDPYNFGYTLRSLYAAGVSGVVMPLRNWMTAAGVVARASAGASELMPLYTADTETAIELFRASGYQILCAGIRDSVSIYEKEFRYPVLLVIGGEKRGISRNLLKKADQIVRIEYGRAFRGSLSAASAATVMAFELFRQNLKP